MENFSPNQLSILRAKYLRKDELGNLAETPEECFRRVAKAVARAEENGKRKKYEEKFYEILSNLEFLPGGRTLANAGTENGQLANCFVLPMEDNIEEEFESVKDSAILKKNGGGVGFSLSRIRPKNDYITQTSGRACGPVALMKILDASSEIFLQDGKRRSGNMIVLSVTHPDILDFITCKQDQNIFHQINYSVAVSDRFMRAVLKNTKWDLINPRTGRKVATVNSRSIFELMTTMGWKNGDPGVLFMDRINRDNPTPQLGPIEAVNLCGEQPLLPYEACNLGSINLVKFLIPEGHLRGVSPGGRRGPLHLGGEKINWQRLEEVIRLATRFLDDVIDACKYPLAKVDRMVKGNRKIGLGVMGWADLLIKMQIPYNSIEAIKFAERVMKFINDISHDESQKLARERGSFPNFEGSQWKKKVKRIRNATTTTIAPTGSISMVAGVSSGIEPLFALSYYKEVMGGVKLPEINQELVEALNNKQILQISNKQINKQMTNITNEEIIAKYIEEITKTGSIQNIKEIPEKVKRVFVSAHDISYDWHVKMQAVFQKYTDNAVSKTINLGNEATVEDVEKAFVLAWKLGCKGITVYRDSSREGQVLNIGLRTKDKGQNQNVLSSKSSVHSSQCPICGTKLVFVEGCNKCPKCGWGTCSI